jgi:hypothetical protein
MSASVSGVKVDDGQMSDASVVARWLNESKGTAREKVRALREELQQIRDGTSDLQRKLEELRRRLLVGENSKLPALDAQYRSTVRQLEKRHAIVNRALARYKFRPRISYTIINDMRAAGLSPDPKKRGFRLHVGEWRLTEPNAVLSMIRLYLSGEWSRLRLCDYCKERWLVAAKSHYRFCGQECRESYYAKSEGFSDRRAEIQRKYRARLKKREAARAAKGLLYDTERSKVSHAKSQKKRP